MKKIAIVTWIKYNNFGTYLQAYALQRTLQKLGYEPTILDDNEIIEEGCIKRNKIYSFLARCKHEFISILISPYNYIAIKKSNAKYHQFQKEKLLIDKNIFPLKQLNNKYDIFICGSDQIWHPSSFIFSPYYYLAFAEKKKVAYAPSIGSTMYPDNFISKVKPLFNRFDYLSVREKNGAEIVRSITGKKVETVLDPTLLLTKKEWEQLVLPNKLYKKKYILCYFLTYNEEYIRSAVNYAKRNSLDIVTFALSRQDNQYADKVLASGPSEFITAIKDASVIFTDSFHGTIFSLLFEKKFFTFKRFTENNSNNQNVRITHLFELLDLNQYFIDASYLDNLDKLSPINYEQVKETLQSKRQASVHYLYEALTN